MEFFFGVLTPKCVAAFNTASSFIIEGEPSDILRSLGDFSFNMFTSQFLTLQILND